MTEAQRGTVLSVMDLEISAVVRDLANRPPGADYWGDKRTDMRELHLAKLSAARKVVVELRVTG